MSTVHCGVIRQTASIIKMSKNFLRTGDKAIISLRFIRYPEYMTAGQKVILRGSRTKAIGKIVQIKSQAFPTQHPQPRTKLRKAKSNLQSGLQEVI